MDNITLLKYGYLGTKALFDSMFDHDSHKQILDPVSCIVRLGLLTFKEKGTKISIAQNKIYFQDPNLLQGPLRWTCGDGRADLHNLCNPIEKAISWYDPVNDGSIENIFKFAISGLTRLKQSYILKNKVIGDSNLVCHSISHYITLLENSLRDIQPQNTNIDDYDNAYFKNLWEKSELEVINNLFTLALDKKKKNEEYTYAINAIESVLQEKDEAVRKIVHKISTSI
jgi:hypothetical protein